MLDGFTFVVISIGRLAQTSGVMDRDRLTVPKKDFKVFDPCRNTIVLPFTPEEVLYLQAMHESFRSWLKINLFGKHGALHLYYNQNQQPAYTLKVSQSTSKNLDVLNDIILISNLPVRIRFDDPGKEQPFTFISGIGSSNLCVHNLECLMCGRVINDRLLKHLKKGQTCLQCLEDVSNFYHPGHSLSWPEMVFWYSVVGPWKETLKFVGEGKVVSLGNRNFIVSTRVKSNVEGRLGPNGNSSPIDFVIEPGFIDVYMYGKWWCIHLTVTWIIEIDGAMLHCDLETDVHQVEHACNNEFGMIRIWSELYPHTHPNYITGILLACWLHYDCVIREKNCFGPVAELSVWKDSLREYKLFHRRSVDHEPRLAGGNGDSKYLLFEV